MPAPIIRPKSNRRKQLALLAGSVLAAVFLLELGVRGYEKARHGWPFFGAPPTRHVVLDEEFGWLPQPATDKPGDTAAFLRFGDPDSTRLKVLIVGDSFTQAVEVAPDKAYFSRLADMLPVEVFAIGALGYGTLQEHLLLDRWLDRIRPDVVVVQVCGNDYINNDHELESCSHVNRHLLRRPYLADDGRIVFRRPRDPLLGWLAPLGRVSRLCRLGLHQVARIRAGYVPGTIEDAIMEAGADHPGYQRAWKTTRTVFGRIAAQCGPRPVVVFPVEDNEPFYGGFRAIARELGLEFWRVWRPPSTPR